MIVWLEHSTGVTKVLGSNPTCNFEILFAVVPSSAAKQPSFTSLKHECMHWTLFHLLCGTLDVFPSLNRQCYFYTKQVFDVSDAFSSGPYTVEILNGNDQDRFEVKDGSYSSVSAPSTPAPDTFTLDGETILLCPNATAGPVTPIPTISPGTVAS